MRRRSPRRKHFARLPFFAGVLVLVPLLLGTVPLPSPRAGAAVPVPGSSERAAAIYAKAAAALRGRDCASAYSALLPLAGTREPEARFANLLLGLYAHACEQVGYSEERLFAAIDPAGLFEDWRLFVLSDSAVARGHVLLGRAALAKLLGDYPASPLRRRALLKAATLAWSQGDSSRALDLIAEGRREGLHGDDGTQLETLAWEIATRLGDGKAQREAARRLLIDSPVQAANLGVIEVFRDQGALSWSMLLSADQLKRRARALLALQLEPNALAALDAVPDRDRDLDWRLQKAQTLTRAHRSLEALQLLSNLDAANAVEPRQAAALEWTRAAAAADLATAQRGRTNLAAQERRRLRTLAQQHLQKVIQLGGDPGLSIRALRSLYADLADSDLFDAALDALRQLRRLDPTDTTGAANLWGRGWQEYGRRNYTGAIGTWSELASLYPEDASSRRGRYWTARAYEALGDAARAQALFAEVAQADTNDFYRQNALARLHNRPVAAPVESVQPWPSDPVLGRARLLSDLGLDDLALSEIELVKEKAQPRSLAALQALLLARKGERRKSIVAIRDAFPALGGPYQAGLPQDALHLYYPLDYEEPIRAGATMNRVPLNLVMGIIRQESAFDLHAQSWAGARGLMQLMPGTARELARSAGLPFSVDRMTDPAWNVQLGTTYLRQVLGMFDGNVELALAAYNGGPYRIKRLWREAGGRDLDSFLEGLGIEESKTYVKRILVLSDSYRQLYLKSS